MRIMLSKKKVVSFLKSASYYYQKGNFYFQQNKLDKALLFFKKTIEVEPENSVNYYNLACLLSRMGYLDKANDIFSSVVYQMDPSLTECYFLMAVNYGLIGNLDKACHLLNLYLRYAPDGEMAQDAEDLLFALREEVEEVDFKEDDEEKESADRKKLPEEEEIISSYHESPEVKNNLLKTLYGKNDQVVNKAMHIYGLLPGKSGEEPLREFVRNPWIRQRLRVRALLEMKNMGVRGQVTVFMGEGLRDIDLSYYPLIAPMWLDEWQDVLDGTLHSMQQSNMYNEKFYEDVQAIWIDFLNNIYPRVPRINKRAIWSAALEYAITKFHFLSITQKRLAQQYNVSPSSISAKYQEINRALNIEHRAYQNMIRYLTQRKDEQLPPEDDKH